MYFSIPLDAQTIYHQLFDVNNTNLLIQHFKDVLMVTIIGMGIKKRNQETKSIQILGFFIRYQCKISKKKIEFM